MAFNPANYTAPKLSKRAALLQKHGYYEGTIRDGIASLTPTQEKYIELAGIVPTASREEISTMYIYGRHEFDIYSEKNEPFKDWMLRLGWLKMTEDGHCVEA